MSRKRPNARNSGRSETRSLVRDFVTRPPQPDSHWIVASCAYLARRPRNHGSARSKNSLAPAANSLHVVALGIEYEGGVVAGRVAFGGVAEPGRAVVRASRFERGGMEGVDLGGVLRDEGGVVPHAVRVKPVDPEDRIVDSVANCVGPIFRKLHDSSQPKRAQR